MFRASALLALGSVVPLRFPCETSTNRVFHPIWPV